MANEGIKKIFVTALTETSTDDKEGVGVLRFVGNKIYKWVKFNNGQDNVAAIVGDCAYYYGVSGDAVTGGYENSVVTMDRTDEYGIGAGIFQSIIADGSYGWLQIRGPATVTQAFTSGSDGSALTSVGAGADGALEEVGADLEAMVAIATDHSAKKLICMFPF